MREDMSEKSKSESPEKKGSAKAQMNLTGMTCATCALNIENGLAGMPGVERANVNFAAEKATVEYDPTRVDLPRIKDAISGLGYGVSTKKSIFQVSGMTCASCVARVEEALSGVPGVVSAGVNLASEKATVEYIEGTDVAELKRAVTDAGYGLSAEAETIEDVTVAAGRDIRALRNRFILAVVLAGYAGTVLGGLAVLPGSVGSIKTPHR